jgi:hypothetical protein
MSKQSHDGVLNLVSSVKVDPGLGFPFSSTQMKPPVNTGFGNGFTIMRPVRLAVPQPPDVVMV